MRYIAVAAMIWGVVLGAFNGPLIGAAFIAAGIGIFIVSSTLSAVSARVRNSKLALMGFGTSAPATADTVSHVVPLITADSECDQQLLDLYWNFRRIDDVAALADKCPTETQARLIELLLDPAGPVSESVDKPTTIADRNAMLDAWNAGDSLAIISARTGRSEWSIGRILLENTAQPVGLGA